MAPVYPQNIQLSDSLGLEAVNRGDNVPYRADDGLYLAPERTWHSPELQQTPIQSVTYDNTDKPAYFDYSNVSTVNELPNGKPQRLSNKTRIVLCIIIVVVLGTGLGIGLGIGMSRSNANAAPAAQTT
jgi:hypothetical protein